MSTKCRGHERRVPRAALGCRVPQQGLGVSGCRAPDLLLCVPCSRDPRPPLLIMLQKQSDHREPCKGKW